MWFVFGFISLFVFIIYGAYKRINASWKGTKDVTNGITYKYKTVSNKDEVKKVFVGIDSVSNYDYAFKKEHSVDNFFKKIGLSNEYQTGNLEFDNNIYIISDDNYLHSQLSSNEKIINIILQIFSLNGTYNCKIKEIRNNSGQLWIEFKTIEKFNKNIIPTISSKFVPLLSQLSKELINTTNNDVKVQLRDPFIIKASIILATSSGLAINGFYHLIGLYYVNLPFTIDTEQLLIDSILVGSGIIFILISFALFFLKRSSRTHLILIELLLIGYFGAISTSYVELRNLNIELSQSTSDIYKTKVIDKTISKNRKSSDTYYLHVKNWNNSNEIVKIKVSLSTYDKFSKNQYINIYQKNGYLNYRWIEQIN